MQEQEARLFDAGWGWLTTALILAVAVAIIAIAANVMRSPVPSGVPPLAMRPPADDPANPPVAAAPNTPRTVDDGAAR